MIEEVLMVFNLFNGLKSLHSNVLEARNQNYFYNWNKQQQNMLCSKVKDVQIFQENHWKKRMPLQKVGLSFTDGLVFKTSALSVRKDR